MAFPLAGARDRAILLKHVHAALGLLKYGVCGIVE